MPAPRSTLRSARRGTDEGRDLSVTPHEFISKWRSSALKERSASQEHFLDLCRMLGVTDSQDAAHHAWSARTTIFGASAGLLLVARTA